MERGQQIATAYFETLSSRRLSVKQANTVWKNALLAKERLFKPYKPTGILTWKNPEVTYVKWLVANGYKDAAYRFRQNFELAQKAVKALQGPEFTPEIANLVENYAENVLQKSGSEAD